MDGNVNMSVYAKSVETGEEVRLCTFADVPVPSDDKYYFYVPNSLYPLEGAYELSMRYATPDGERGLPTYPKSQQPRRSCQIRNICRKASSRRSTCR